MNSEETKIKTLVKNESETNLGTEIDESNERVIGFFNKYLLKLKDNFKNPHVKKTIEYGVYGGMTQKEQQAYFETQEEAVKATRYSALFDFSTTFVISTAPALFDLVSKSVSQYDADYGIYTALILLGQSAAVSSARVAYTYITKKPLESFSILSVLANSTSYIKQNIDSVGIDSVGFVLRANHPEMFYERDKFFDLKQEELKLNGKKFEGLEALIEKRAI